MEPKEMSPRWTRFGQGFFWIFGVALPLATIGTELTARWSATILFDPLPTVWHVLLVLLVPAAHVYAWVALHRDQAPEKPVHATNGIATGVSAFYTLLYLPAVPIGLIGLVFYGLGLLPLAPLFALAVAILLRRRLRWRGRDAGVATGRPFWLGLAGAFLALVALDLPRTVTRVAVGRVANGTEAERRQALTLLRHFGSESSLLRMCYGARPSGTDVAGAFLARPFTTQQAREVFFRMTGRAFNSVPPPELRTLRGPGIDPFDWEAGGPQVGQVRKGLSLASSRIDGSVDADAALGYLEWTLEFRNDTPRPQEARALVALPPGAVVSRLTLWIAGEEREAAFAARGVTRQAYEAVVRRRLDPVLVTTAGRDRVLVQCFPVPPGGLMKTRLGITVPLALASLDEGHLALPQIAERNFRIPDERRHSVWIEGTGALGSAGLAAETQADGTAVLRADLSDAEIAGPQGRITVSRSPTARDAWALDSRGEDTPAVVRQLIQEREREAVPIVVVIDGSAAMGPEKQAMARALAGSPSGSVARVLVAGDDVHELPAARAGIGSWADQLGSVEFVGGQDNLPALEAAWDEAHRVNGVVLWVHGPQPVLLGSVEGLRQRWGRRPDGPRLVALGLVVGPNRVLEGLDDVDGVRASSREGSLEEDLERLLSRWGTPQVGIEVVREREPEASSPVVRERETSDHLVRLWAHDEIRRLQVSPAGRETAVELATRYQLVTPVSGAVVLETAEQFERAGLTPAAQADVPTIPEPETWALLALAFVTVAFFIHRRRHACRV